MHCLAMTFPSSLYWTLLAKAIQSIGAAMSSLSHNMAFINVDYSLDSLDMKADSPGQLSQADSTPLQWLSQSL